ALHQTHYGVPINGSDDATAGYLRVPLVSATYTPGDGYTLPNVCGVEYVPLRPPMPLHDEVPAPLEPLAPALLFTPTPTPMPVSPQPCSPPSGGAASALPTPVTLFETPPHGSGTDDDDDGDDDAAATTPDGKPALAATPTPAAEQQTASPLPAPTDQAPPSTPLRRSTRTKPQPATAASTAHGAQASEHDTRVGASVACERDCAGGGGGSGACTNQWPYDTAAADRRRAPLVRVHIAAASHISRSDKGVRVDTTVEAGDVVMEYVGTIVDAQTARALARQRNAYVAGIGGVYVDASAAKGRPSRYVNHSCVPNCAIMRKRCRDDAPERLFIVALRRIGAGEWLTIDYGDEFLHALIDQCKCGHLHECRQPFGRAVALDDGDIAAGTVAVGNNNSGGSVARTSKRKRKAVDYVALQRELYGDGDDDESSDGGEYVPSNDEDDADSHSGTSSADDDDDDDDDHDDDQQPQPVQSRSKRCKVVRLDYAALYAQQYGDASSSSSDGGEYAPADDTDDDDADADDDSSDGCEAAGSGGGSDDDDDNDDDDSDNNATAAPISLAERIGKSVLSEPDAEMVRLAAAAASADGLRAHLSTVAEQLSAFSGRGGAASAAAAAAEAAACDGDADVTSMRAHVQAAQVVERVHATSGALLFYARFAIAERLYECVQAQIAEYKRTKSKAQRRAEFTDAHAVKRVLERFAAAFADAPAQLANRLYSSAVALHEPHCAWLLDAIRAGRVAVGAGLLGAKVLLRFTRSSLSAAVAAEAARIAGAGAARV
ncbi:MAG: SET domain-containing protein-lysine N-methyltransferase, partial [Planctomycetes bacterium]|nr:SET domain-containing protein-lysine N-methyltransferase [Planctomycetota bacterium]